MGNAKVLKFGAVESTNSFLDKIVRDGARKMLQAAWGDEVNALMKQHGLKVDSAGRRICVRNVHLPTQEFVAGAGRLEIEQPRLRDKSEDSYRR